MTRKVVKKAQITYAWGMDYQRGVAAVVLGTMQDGGLPHIGCDCHRCRNAQANPDLARFAASLAIVDRRWARPAVWIIDATPDIKWQLYMLAADLGNDPQRPGRLRQPDGILLTHAHMGHIGGLLQLGPEAMAVRQLPVLAPPGLVHLLQETFLWQPLLSRLVLRPCPPGEPLSLSPGLQVTAVPVPHRDEWGAGTVAYLIKGPQHSLLYLPDIDDWDLWPVALEQLEAVDIAMVDASFSSKDELGGRAPAAHPLVPDTLQRFRHLAERIVFTHINHTNPILDHQSLQQQAVLASGARIAYRGQEIQL